MIFVDGAPFESPPSSSEESSTDVLSRLLDHPALLYASDSLKAKPEKTFSVAKELGTEGSVGEESGTESSVTEEFGAESLRKSKWVYLFQREYATVDPALVGYVGTDEATTCIGFAIRDRKNGMVSVAHIDSPKVVDKGLNQMLSTFVNHRLEDDLEVHMIGAFDDSPPKHANAISSPQSDVTSDGYSRPLCSKIIRTLRKRSERFHLQTLCVLGRNTWGDSKENARPIFSGFVVETSTGFVIPAKFDETSRCPDELVRRIRVTASSEDRRWDDKLLETYDTQTDTFKIAPCRWTERQVQIARFLRDKPDSYILHNCSTSPFAEDPDFVKNEKRKWEFLIEYPDWKDAFPLEQPRIWKRTEYGSWTRSILENASAENNMLKFFKMSPIRESACYLCLS